MAPKRSKRKADDDLAVVQSVDRSEELAQDITNLIDRPGDGHADVVFVVGEKSFGSLRTFLAMRSEFFRRMFAGKFTESSGGSIPFPQFGHDPSAFRSFLFFMHFGKFVHRDMLELMHVYDIADFFGCSGLKDDCLSLLKTAEVTKDIAVELLIFAGRHDDCLCLVTTAARHIAIHADHCLADAASSALLPQAFLHHMFVCDHSNVSEITLFRILMKLDAQQQRDLARHMRLPLIAAADIVKEVSPSGLVDKDLCIQALAHQLDPSSVEQPKEAVRIRRFSPEWVFPPEVVELDIIEELCSSV